MIRVLLADASRPERERLREILESDPEIRVIAEASNGLEAVGRCLSAAPDVVVMDLQMPGLDGVSAVEQIMAARPTPIVILSATARPGEVKSAFRAVRAGALEALPRPEGTTSDPSCRKLGEDLLRRVKLYARAGGREGWGGVETASALSLDLPLPSVSPRVVAIGASTGGPKTVQALLSALPSRFPCPILLVQHLSRDFTRGFAEWLRRETALVVRVVEGAEPLCPGSVYLAQGGRHLVVRGGRAVLSDDPPANGFRPSVDVLFHSLARECGHLAIAVLLTGMGRDGASGALAVRQAGGHVLVQNEESSVIFGMPRAATELGAPTRVVAAGDLPIALAEAVSDTPAG